MAKKVYYTIHENTKVKSLLGFPIEKIKYPINSRTKRCPALKANNDFFVIKSPYTFHLRHHFNNRQESTIELLENNSFRYEVFNDILGLHPVDQRNSPNIPTIQFLLNYIFHTKEKDIEIEVFPAFMNHELNRQPLVSAYGKFPISNWLRPINFPFDWVKPNEDIFIPRGSDLLYVKFNKPVILLKSDYTPELRLKVESCMNMSSHFTSKNVNDWKFLFKHAKEILKL